MVPLLRVCACLENLDIDIFLSLSLEIKVFYYISPFKEILRQTQESVCRRACFFKMLLNAQRRYANKPILLELPPV